MAEMALINAPSKRTVGDIARSMLAAKSYKAAVNIFRSFPNPLEIVARYALEAGSYPRMVHLRTPVGPRPVALHSFHDVRSLVVCFAKEDYQIGHNVRCAVDFGSNIGMSGLYFLTRNPEATAYLFEPLPQNAKRLMENLKGLEQRYVLDQSAIGLEDGIGNFLFEPTGRYGGIEGMLDTREEIERPYRLDVPIRCATRCLREILRKEGSIDVLKVNIEGLESDVLRSLPPDVLRNVGVICAEIFNFDGEIDGFRKEKYGRNITRFTNRRSHCARATVRADEL
jgi:FkbM family methyltransferase